MARIKDIAQAVGVSPATVSRVLNQDSTLSVSDAKRRAIVETAERLNYRTPRRRRIKQSGASQGSKIGIVHFLTSNEDIADPYYIGVCQGIERTLAQSGLTSERIYPSAAGQVPQVPGDISGVISLGPQDPEQVSWLIENCEHLVFADTDPERPGYDRVFADIGEAMTQLLVRLRIKGVDHIGYIGSARAEDNHPEPQRDPRLVALRSWMQANPEVEVTIKLTELSANGGYDGALAMFDGQDRPQVIIGTNDNVAIGVYRAAAERGLSIPDDVTIIGFNDIPAAAFLKPTLATVSVPAEHIGESAADLIVERLDGRTHPKLVQLETIFLQRESLHESLRTAQAP